MKSRPLQGSDGKRQEQGKSRDKEEITDKKERKGRKQEKQKGKGRTTDLQNQPFNSSISFLQKGKLRTREEK